MFWKKKVLPPSLPQVTERELEIVTNVLGSMNNYADSWVVSSDGFGCPRLTSTEWEQANTIHARKNEIIYIASSHRPKLTYNGAEISLTSTSKKRLNDASKELVQDKLLQSLRPSNDNHTP